MWSKEVSLRSNASKAQIWNLWTDVSNWNVWDDQVVSSSLNGPFTTGQKGELVPKGGPKSIFELSEVSPQKSFTTSTKLPLGKMDFIHTMKEVEGEILLAHKVEIKGPLTFLFSRVIGNNIVKELPIALDNLSALAQKKN